MSKLDGAAGSYCGCPAYEEVGLPFIIAVRFRPLPPCGCVCCCGCWGLGAEAGPPRMRISGAGDRARIVGSGPGGAGDLERMFGAAWTGAGDLARIGMFPLCGAGDLDLTTAFDGCGLAARGTVAVGPGLLRPSLLAGRPMELGGRPTGALTEEPIPQLSVLDRISFDVNAGWGTPSADCARTLLSYAGGGVPRCAAKTSVV